MVVGGIRRHHGPLPVLVDQREADQAVDIEVYTDGGARPKNPGPAGWAFILKTPTGDIRGSGGEIDSTNNRMELLAAIEGLRAIMAYGYQYEHVTVVSDSEYVVLGMNQWIVGWVKRGWKKSNGRPVENQDLWKRLVNLAACIDRLQWTWVKGHGKGDLYNEYNSLVDSMATAAALAQYEIAQSHAS